MQFGVFPYTRPKKAPADIGSGQTPALQQRWALEFLPGRACSGHLAITAPGHNSSWLSKAHRESPISEPLDFCRWFILAD
jgi:hypothetical protein